MQDQLDFWRGWSQGQPADDQPCLRDWAPRKTEHQGLGEFIQLAVLHTNYHTTFLRSKHCPHNSAGRGPLKALYLEAYWTLPHESLPSADFNLCLFIVIHYNCEHNSFDEFCESFQQIIESEAGSREPLTCKWCQKWGWPWWPLKTAEYIHFLFVYTHTYIYFTC